MSSEGSISTYMTKQRGPGMPSLRGLDHYGMTVPNVDAAVGFFCDVLGCEELYKLGTFRVEEGDWMTEHLNVHARAEITNMRMIRCGQAAMSNCSSMKRRTNTTSSRATQTMPAIICVFTSIIFLTRSNTSKAME